MYILGSTKILYSYIPSTYYFYVFVLTRTCTSTYSVCTGTNIFEGFRPGRGVRIPDVVQQGSQPTAGDGEEAHEEEAPADPGPAGAQADAAAAAEPAATAAEPAATGAKPPATGKPAPAGHGRRGPGEEK
jgi:hypothetical protein